MSCVDVRRRKRLLSKIAEKIKNKVPTSSIIDFMNLNEPEIGAENMDDIIDLSGNTLLSYAFKFSDIILIKYLIQKYIKPYLIFDGTFLYARIRRLNENVLDSAISLIQFLTNFEDIEYIINFILSSNLELKFIAEDIYNIHGSHGGHSDQDINPIIIKIANKILIGNFYNDYIRMTTNQFSISEFIEKNHCNKLWFYSLKNNVLGLRNESPMHRIIKGEILINDKIRLMSELVSIDCNLLYATYQPYPYDKLICDPVNYIIVLDDNNRLCCVNSPINEQFTTLFEAVIRLHVQYNTNYQKLFEGREEIISIMCSNRSNVNSYKYLKTLIKYGFKVAMKLLFKLLQQLQINYTNYPEDIDELIQQQETEMTPSSTKKVFMANGNIIVTYTKNELLESEKHMIEAEERVRVLETCITNSSLDAIGSFFDEIPIPLLDGLSQKLPVQLYKNFGKQCIRCDNDAVSYCSKCKLVRYCSLNCQRENWEYHKHVCYTKEDESAKDTKEDESAIDAKEDESAKDTKEDESAIDTKEDEITTKDKKKEKG